jgi:micrococcal nuclease
MTLLKKLAVCVAVAICTLTGTLNFNVQAQTTQRVCKVIAVTDGDTITCQRTKRAKWKFRLAAIDAPELAQPYGPEARVALRTRILNRYVWVRFNPYVPDHFGRFVGQIFDATGDINLFLIDSGLAWFNSEYAEGLPTATASAYQAAHTDAQSLHKGLWADPLPIPPWQWRAEH